MNRFLRACFISDTIEKKIILFNFVLKVLNEIYWIALVLVRISFTVIPTVHRVKKDSIDFH